MQQARTTTVPTFIWAKLGFFDLLNSNNFLSLLHNSASNFLKKKSQLKLSVSKKTGIFFILAYIMV